MGFHSERAAAGQGLSGLNKWWLQVQSETSAGLHPDQNSACLWDHASIPARIQLPGNTSCPPEHCETDGPPSVASLATFTDHVQTLTNHSAVVLDSNGCYHQSAMTEWPASRWQWRGCLQRAEQAVGESKLWETWLQNQDLLQDYTNILMLGQGCLGPATLCGSCRERIFSNEAYQEWLELSHSANILQPSMWKTAGARALNRWWEECLRASLSVNLRSGDGVDALTKQTIFFSVYFTLS